MKSQARAVMSKVKSLHAHNCCLRSSRPAAFHPRSTSPCSSTSCKEEVSLAATPQERRKHEANADKAASELHNVDNIVADSENRHVLSVFTAKETEIVSKTNIEESDVKLSVTEDSEESHPMFKCTQCDCIHTP